MCSPFTVPPAPGREDAVAGWFGETGWGRDDACEANGVATTLREDPAGAVFCAGLAGLAPRFGCAEGADATA